MSFSTGPKPSRDLNFFITSSIPSFGIICVVVHEPNIPDPINFLWISKSSADATVINPSVINTLLAGG